MSHSIVGLQASVKTGVAVFVVHILLGVPTRQEERRDEMREGKGGKEMRTKKRREDKTR